MNDDIEWGEWQPGIEKRSVVGGRDHQFQSVGGVSQYRLRKAPPAPVVETVYASVWVLDGKAHITPSVAHANMAMTLQVRDGEVDMSVAPIAAWVKP